METAKQLVEPLAKLRKDIRAATILTDQEARFLVDTYYLLQDHRKRAASQIGELKKSGEPHETIMWFLEIYQRLEADLKKILDAYSDKHPVAVAAKNNVRGIGPVIAAGLLAHIDMNIAKTAGSIWRFAGMDPTSKWGKHEKRPWNAQLKVLCWKIGECFVKTSNHSDGFYGKLYQLRKDLEQERNKALQFKDQARAKVETVKKKTIAYKFYSKDQLPPAHIHARAKRWVVKLFLAHWFERMYQYEFGQPAPRPYVIEHLGHVDMIKCPW